MHEKVVKYALKSWIWVLPISWHGGRTHDAYAQRIAGILAIVYLATRGEGSQHGCMRFLFS